MHSGNKIVSTSRQLEQVPNNRAFLRVNLILVCQTSRIYRSLDYLFLDNVISVLICYVKSVRTYLR
jgi:hypothetical protein